MDALREFLAARDDAAADIHASMRSHVIAGRGDDVYLLLHGLTASPPAWAPIATALGSAGASVVSLRLPLHGRADRLTDALEGLSSQMLIDDLHEVVAAAAAGGRRVIIGGHSLGGTLALHAAATLPAVERVVAIAPFLGVAGVPHEVHRWAVPLVRRLPNVFLWWDPIERERQQPTHGYPRYPLHALAVGIEIADAVYLDADRAPLARSIDFVVNARESSVNNRTVRRLATRWRRSHGSIVVHELDGLPPSHDIIEPERPNSGRARETLVRLLRGETSTSASVTHAI